MGAYGNVPDRRSQVLLHRWHLQFAGLPVPFILHLDIRSDPPVPVVLRNRMLKVDFDLEHRRTPLERSLPLLFLRAVDLFENAFILILHFLDLPLERLEFLLKGLGLSGTLWRGVELLGICDVARTCACAGRGCHRMEAVSRKRKESIDPGEGPVVVMGKSTCAAQHRLLLVAVRLSISLLSSLLHRYYTNRLGVEHCAVGADLR